MYNWNTLQKHNMWSDHVIVDHYVNIFLTLPLNDHAINLNYIKINVFNVNIN